MPRIAANHGQFHGTPKVKGPDPRERKTQERVRSIVRKAKQRPTTFTPKNNLERTLLLSYCREFRVKWMETDAGFSLWAR